LHDYGKRRNGPFVAINMAAIPRDLIESELFGHEKGAFTGAVSRHPGHFELAEGGTLFLDEIGDMPADAQTRLLRVLQQGEFSTVGGRTPIKTNVRIIAATNQDLQQLIRQGLFREDLFYRLNVVPMRMPPLRERTEDVPDLARHFLKQAEASGLPAKRISKDALDQLRTYNWPGNVRELENLIQRLIALYPEEVIEGPVVASELATISNASPFDAHNDGDGDDQLGGDSIGASVHQHLKRYFNAHGDSLPPAGLYDRVLHEVERPMIELCLVATRGNQIRAAELLGLNRNTLRKKIKELDIQVVRGLN
jgi:two-component system nitrogen regulation response regulator GlnG